MQRVVVRRAPATSAPPIGLLRTVTPEGETNLVLAYASRRDSDERLWVRVPLSALPNGQSGWVPRDALGDLHLVRTRLGIGQPRWPTPAGEFYVRVRLRNYRDPFYGPVAFGTNARSPWLTDWPRGGVVGIHGTNAPQLIPGRISHGCIRMRNAAIVLLARLMPLGTPVSIR